MVVDDDPNIRELVCALLRNTGFEYCKAKYGRGALQQMMEESPNLAVIDLMMPNMVGYELCRQLEAILRKPARFCAHSKSGASVQSRRLRSWSG